MGRTREAGRVRAARHAVSCCLLACLLAVAACTGAQPDPPLPDPESVALEVEIVNPTTGLDEAERARVETGVGDALSAYVVAGFLGDYPREDFVAAFDDFSGRLPASAARDIEVLTAAGFDDAEKVVATRLNARLSCFVVDGEVQGVAAWVDLAFTADVDGQTEPFGVTGRISLVRREDRWVVFGYRVRPTDGVVG